MKRWWPALMIVAVACGGPDDPEAERIAQQEKLAKVLNREVRPVVDRYIRAMVKGDVETLYEMQSAEIRREKTLEQFRGHWDPNAERYRAIARTIHVNWVKPHDIYAIVQVKSTQGTEFWALIEEGDDWRLHRTSTNFLSLLDNLK